MTINIKRLVIQMQFVKFAHPIYHLTFKTQSFYTYTTQSELN